MRRAPTIAPPLIELRREPRASTRPRRTSARLSDLTLYCGAPNRRAPSTSPLLNRRKRSDCPKLNAFVHFLLVPDLAVRDRRLHVADGQRREASRGFANAREKCVGAGPGSSASTNRMPKSRLSK